MRDGCSQFSCRRQIHDPTPRTDRQLAYARRVRRDMTTAEEVLWRSLRNRGSGRKFRRVVPIGPYVADFVCIAAKLIVELDGPPRENPEQTFDDRRCDAWLRRRGCHVLRFSNDMVIGGSFFGKD
ncbi:MAG: endonuclease domain-containing protein [Beijerinckiaceae bacterium]